MQVIIPVGITNSGKTTFFNALKEESDKMLSRISLTEIRKKLTGIDVIDPQQESLVISFAISTLKGAIAHKMPIIFWDNKNLLREDRSAVIKEALKANYNVTGMFFQIEPITAMERSIDRKVNISLTTVQNEYNTIQEPEYSEGFSDIFIIKETK